MSFPKTPPVSTEAEAKVVSGLVAVVSSAFSLIDTTVLPFTSPVVSSRSASGEVTVDTDTVKLSSKADLVLVSVESSARVADVLSVGTGVSDEVGSVATGEVLVKLELLKEDSEVRSLLLGIWVVALTKVLLSVRLVCSALEVVIGFELVIVAMSVLGEDMKLTLDDIVGLSVEDSSGLDISGLTVDISVVLDISGVVLVKSVLDTSEQTLEDISVLTTVVKGVMSEDASGFDVLKSVLPNEGSRLLLRMDTSVVASLGENSSEDIELNTSVSLVISMVDVMEDVLLSATVVAELDTDTISEVWGDVGNSVVATPEDCSSKFAVKDDSLVEPMNTEVDEESRLLPVKVGRDAYFGLAS